MAHPMAEMQVRQVEATLEDALAFDSIDLAENLQGRLSHHQTMMLQGYIARIIVFIWGVIQIISTRWFLQETEPNTLDLALWGVFSALFSIGCYTLLSHKLCSTQVLSVEGVVEKLPQKYGRTSFVAYTLIVGNTTFSVNAQIYAAFEGGGSYRVFYAPLLNILLCAVQN